MYIKKIHIDSFGKLSDRTFEFSDGVNVIEGANESGKSTLAMFIKFMLYGLSGRGTDKDISEREKYVSWETGKAAGEMTVMSGGREYLIERELFVFSEKDTVREKVTVTDTENGEKMFKGIQPGAALLGMNEELFVNTVFVRQLSDAKIDGTGTAAAIENMLLTGSEGLSSKKAMEKLDRARVALKHKTGTGGRINDILREKARLEGNLAQAERASSEIITLEASLGEIGERISEKESEVKECAEICDSYDKIMRYRQVEAARRYEKEIEDAENELEKYEKYGNIPKKTREIYRLSSEISASDEKLKVCRKRVAEYEDILPEAMTEKEIENAYSDIKRAEKSESHKSLIIWGIIFLILCVAAVVLDVAVLSETYNLPCLGAAAVFLFIGALLFGIGISRKKTFGAVMKSWDADGIPDLKLTVEKYIKGAKMRSDPKSEFSVLCEETKALEGERAMNINALREICLTFTEEVPDTDIFVKNALEAAERYENEIKILGEKRLEASGKYGAISSVLGVDGGAAVEDAAKAALLTDAGKSAENLTRQDSEKYLRRKSLAEATLPGLREQYSEKNTRLGILKKTTENPADIAAKTNELEKEAETLGKNFDAIICAMDAIKTAGENLRRTLIPRAAKKTGKLTGDFTNGKYTDITVGRDFGVLVGDGGKMRDIKALSAGTSDMIYLSLRTALMLELFPEETPPQIFDESFARVDEKRLTRILHLLSVLGESTQSLIFSCRELEGDICKTLDGANTVSV